MRFVPDSGATETRFDSALHLIPRAVAALVLAVSFAGSAAAGALEDGVRTRTYGGVVVSLTMIPDGICPFF